MSTDSGSARRTPGKRRTRSTAGSLRPRSPSSTETFDPSLALCYQLNPASIESRVVPENYVNTIRRTVFFAPHAALLSRSNAYSHESIQLLTHTRSSTHTADPLPLLKPRPFFHPPLFLQFISESSSACPTMGRRHSPLINVTSMTTPPQF